MFKYLSDDLRISFRNQYLLQYVGCYIIFYTPVFRRDVLCYGDVRPSGSPSLRQSQFPAFFSCMPRHIELKFGVWLHSYARKIKFDCRRFASILEGVMPLIKLRIQEIHIFFNCFLHTLTYWAEILHLTLFYCTTDQVRVSSLCVSFWRSYAPFELRI